MQLFEGRTLMHVTFLWKDSDSGGGNCPALYKTEEPSGYIQQGKILDDQARAQLRNLATDESGVWVPDNVMDRLIEPIVEERVQQRLRELGLE